MKVIFFVEGSSQVVVALEVWLAAQGRTIVEAEEVLAVTMLYYENLYGPDWVSKMRPAPKEYWDMWDSGIPRDGTPWDSRFSDGRIKKP